MTKPVYVLLVNTNGSGDTIECLESLLRSDYPDVRVLVMDNGSRDGSEERIRAWALGTDPPPAPASSLPQEVRAPAVSKPIGFVTLTREELQAGAPLDWSSTRVALVLCGANLGFTGANNVGFRYVRARERDAYLLLLNNDTVIAPTAVSRMVAVAEANANAGSVGATLLQYRAPDRVETYAGARLARSTGFSSLIGAGAPRSAPRDSQVALDFISGCCMLIPGPVAARVGELDERFFIYCEDTDWGLRISSAGFDLLIAPDAEVWHKGGGTTVHRSEFHDYHNVKSVLHLIRKHRPAALPIAVPNSIARFLLPKLWRGQWGRMRAVLRGYRDFWRETRRASPRSPALLVNDSLA